MAVVLAVIGAGLVVTLPVEAGVAWTPAASMSQARSGHAAVALPDGRVFVVGGRTVTGFADTAEVYDPVANAWSPAYMPAFGSAATATLLSNGRVLVAGGSHQSGPCPSADCVDNKAALYDPGTNSFTAISPMSQRRRGHTATLLNDGTLLVAGGASTELSVFESAELFEPGTNSWVPVGSMAHGREFHTATLLPSGRVLVAGGGQGGVSGIATAEVYDPTSRTWSPAPDMAFARYAATATRLNDGRVLVAGGGGVAGGTGTVVGQAQAELYHPDTNTWTLDGTLAQGRFYHTATLLADGRVLVAGGLPVIEGASGTPLTSTEMYDPATGAWTPTASMNAPRWRHTATRLAGNEVLATGGDPITASTERYSAGGPSTTTTTTTVRPRVPVRVCALIESLRRFLGPRTDPLLQRLGCPTPSPG